MKQLIPIFYFATALFIVGCNQERANNFNTAPADPAKNASIVNGLKSAQNASRVSLNVPSSQSKTTNPPTYSNYNQTAVTTTSNGSNPPHGQPGHRCDIPVGSPLSASIAKPSATNNITAASSAKAPANINSTALKQNVTLPETKPGMNPPHGQPGHRCDIAVGTPLNSKPKTTQTVASNTVTTVKSTDTTKAAQVVTPEGMNPPHGQSGHDCKVPVGAPLKKS